MHDDEHLMAQALTLAAKGLTLTSPNPRVGCVIIGNSGQLLGQGHTQRAGEEHAEIMALRDAHASGHNVAGATAYVTLEPCSHKGRTGPCCDALIAAGISKIVASLEDPNPAVSGRGFARLRAAGVVVETGLGAEQSRDLNIGFFSRMLRQTPWVRIKSASSLDGITALNNGKSQWITSDEARVDGHAWRARACAVLTGIGTIMQDNPRLDVRLVPTKRQPHLIVVDSQLHTPLDAAIFTAGRSIIIYTAVHDKAKEASLEAKGATVVCIPGANGKVDLTAMLRDLAQREINEVHVEAGKTLNGALVRECLADEFLLYMAPKLLGQGLGIAQFGPLEELSQSVTLQFQSISQVGADLRILTRISGRSQF